MMSMVNLKEVIIYVSLLRLHAQIFAVGDRYDVSGLMQLAVKSILQGVTRVGVLENSWSLSRTFKREVPAQYARYAMQPSAVARSKMADIVNDDKIGPACKKIISDVYDFAAAILYLYIKAPPICALQFLWNIPGYGAFAGQMYEA